MNIRVSIVLLFAIIANASAQEKRHPADVEPLHVQLWPSRKEPSLDVYRALAASSMDTVVVIVPGGGFAALSPYDRLLAEYFRQEGYPAVVVNYRVLPAHYPAAVNDVMRAIRLVRKNSAAWNIKANRIALLGESAGGMLAAIVATQPNLLTDPDDDLASTFSTRPDLLVLLCPVISAVANSRYHGVDRWLGDNVTNTLREQVSPELHVAVDAPPAILFHAVDDPVVPYQGTLDFARAYWKVGGSAELHLFPHGGHGHAFFDSPTVSRVWRQEVLLWLGAHSTTEPN